VLEQHRDYGPQYKTPQFHSGYNEIVLDVTGWDRALPSLIQAFFIVDGGSAQAEEKSRAAHKAFLEAFPQVSAADVPMLRFRPQNWEAPFAVIAN